MSSVLRACENAVGLSMCDGPMETVFTKRQVPFETWGWLYIGRKSVSDYCYHCWVVEAIFKKLYWCMLREKKGEVLGWNRCWVSAYLVGVTRRKRGDHGAVSCWWAVVAGCYFLVAPVRKSIKDQLTGKVKSDMWVARAGTWQPGSLHGSRMGYLPCLTSCRLLGLYPRARGEHHTSQLLWVAA